MMEGPVGCVDGGRQAWIPAGVPRRDNGGYNRGDCLRSYVGNGRCLYGHRVDKRAVGVHEDGGVQWRRILEHDKRNNSAR